MNSMNTKYLMHYGVMGMKWGVRRYQNEDGSYKSGAEGRYTQGGNGTIKKSIVNVAKRYHQAAISRGEKRAEHVKSAITKAKENEIARGKDLSKRGGINRIPGRTIGKILTNEISLSATSYSAKIIASMLGRSDLNYAIDAYTNAARVGLRAGELINAGREAVDIMLYEESKKKK